MDNISDNASANAPSSAYSPTSFAQTCTFSEVEAELNRWASLAAPNENRETAKEKC